MHLIDVADMPKNQHRFFVDEHREAKNFNLAKKFNTHESLLDRRSNRLTMDQLEHLELPWMDIEFQKEMKKNRSKNFKELIHRVNRNESLLKLESTYDLKIVIFFNLFIYFYFDLTLTYFQKIKSRPRKNFIYILLMPIINFF